MPISENKGTLLYTEKRFHPHWIEFYIRGGI